MGQLTRLRHRVLAPHAKPAFLASLPGGARVLDVGCGGHSPTLFKRFNPALRYTGIDISDDDIDAADRAAMDEFVLSTPDRFVEDLRRWNGVFDAVVSSHNIEHVNDPVTCMQAMCDALKAGGRMHVSFPSQASAQFPRRDGTLNFHDDETHRDLPDPDTLIDVARDRGVQLTARVDRHRPPAYAAIGLLTEPISARRKRVMRGTWALWGFESILEFGKPN